MLVCVLIVVKVEIFVVRVEMVIVRVEAVHLVLDDSNIREGVLVGVFVDVGGLLLPEVGVDLGSLLQVPLDVPFVVCVLVGLFVEHGLVFGFPDGLQVLFHFEFPGI